MYRLQGLMHVQIARTHASVYRLQGLMHVQTARTHACTDCKDSCISVQTQQGLMFVELHGLVRRRCVDSYVEAPWTRT